MVRAPCCEKVGLKTGRWTAEEDEILTRYIQQHGEGSWRSLPKNAGLLRCGKSCRLRWINYLRSDLKRGNFTTEEEETIIRLHRSVGNRWSLIASHLPGRTDNEVKNYWNSHLSRKIYSFKSITDNGSMLKMTAIDLIKMANPSSKRRGGRVSRFVAKKYNKNNIHPINATSRTNDFTATDNACRVAVGKTDELRVINGAEKVSQGKDDEVGLTQDTMDKHIYETTEWWECIDGMNDHSFSNGQAGFPSTISLSPKALEEETTIVVEPFDIQDHCFSTTALPNENFLTELSASMDIPPKPNEGMNEPLAQDCNLARNNGSWDPNTQAGKLGKSFSPLYSEFNNEKWTYNERDFDAGAYDCGLWDEDNDNILLWV